VESLTPEAVGAPEEQIHLPPGEPRGADFRAVDPPTPEADASMQAKAPGTPEVNAGMASSPEDVSLGASVEESAPRQEGLETAEVQKAGRRDEEEKVCRICLDSEETLENPLIAPCKCAGSMRYVHRECLDEWRVTCFNPKALVGCTICHAPFSIRYKGNDVDGKKDVSGRRWWVRLGREVAWYTGVRFCAFLAVVVTIGFLPQFFMGAGLAALHPNPVVSHLLLGTGTTFALVGTAAVWQVFWQIGLFRGGETFLDAFCRHRAGGGGGKSGAEIVICILIVIGLACCLYFLITGIIHILSEGRHEVVRAVRGANEQVRRQMVKDYFVQDMAQECSGKDECGPHAERKEEADRKCSKDPAQ